MKLSVREKPQRPGIGRPERRDGAFGSLEGTDLEGVERAKIDALAARRASDEREVAAVGRQGGLAFDLAGLEAHAIRERNREPDRARRRGRTDAARRQRPGERGRQRRGDRPGQRPRQSAPRRGRGSRHAGPAARFAQPVLERREVAREVAGRGVAVVRRLREAALDDPAQRRRRQRGQGRRSAPGSSRMIAERVSGVLPR